MAHPFRSLTSYHLASAAPLSISGPLSQSILVISRAIDPDGQAFLDKVLGAVNLGKGDFTLIQFNEDARFRLAEYISLKGKTLLFFDISPSAAGLSLKASLFQPIRGYSFTCLFCSSISTIQEDQQIKRQLWGALKDVFPQG